MTNSKSLALVVVSLGGTVTGRTNAGLLADIVRALGGTPTGDTNADLIGEIAAALGGTAGEGTNADRLRAVAEALEVDASGTNAEVLAAILTGLGGEAGAGDTNATLIMGISEHPPGPGPTPTPKYTVRFHVATDSVGYGSVSAQTATGIESGAAIVASTASVTIGGVSKCTANPEEDTAEYEYAFVKWTGADDASTAVPGTVTGDTDLYAHFSRTPVTPPVQSFTAYFHVATDSVGYGSVSVQSVAGVPSGTSVTVAQTVAVGAVGSCTATPEEDTAEYEYAFVSWTGADDASTPAPTEVTGDVHYYAHFSRTAVGPQPMDPSLFTFTVSGGEATVTGWAGTEPEAGYDLYFPDTDGAGHQLTTIANVSSSGTSPWTGARSLMGDKITTVGTYTFKNSQVATVDLPAATSIKKGAFYNCASLASLDVPSATSINDSAFAGCTSLEAVDLPAATVLNAEAFAGCSGLKTVSLPAISTMRNYVFDSRAMTSMTFGPLEHFDSDGAHPFRNLVFYDTDGTTQLTVWDLANGTFVGTYDHLVKQ